MCIRDSVEALQFLDTTIHLDTSNISFITEKVNYEEPPFVNGTKPDLIVGTSADEYFDAERQGAWVKGGDGYDTLLVFEE